MPLVNAKCTNCGANLKVDNTKDAAICEFCGTPYIVERAIANVSSNSPSAIETQLKALKNELFSLNDNKSVYPRVENLVREPMNDDEKSLLLEILFYILPLYYSHSDYVNLWKKYLSINEKDSDYDDETECLPMTCDDAIELDFSDEIEIEDTCYFAFDCYKNILFISKTTPNKELIIKNHWDIHDKKHNEYVSKNQKFFNVNNSRELEKVFRGYLPSCAINSVSYDTANQSIAKLQKFLKDNYLKLEYSLLENYGQLRKENNIIDERRATISINRVCSNKLISLHLSIDYNGYNPDFCDAEFEFYTTVGDSVDKIIENYKNRVKTENYRNNNLCQHCGGKFKGLFKKVCSKCGKPKDY